MASMTPAHFYAFNAVMTVLGLVVAVVTVVVSWWALALWVAFCIGGFVGSMEALWRLEHEKRYR